MEALISFIPLTGIPAKQFRIEFGFDDEGYAFPHIPRGLKPPLMVKAEDSTSPFSITQTAPPIQGLSTRNLHLITITFSDALWDNFIHYADPTRFPGRANFDRKTLDVAIGGEPEATPRSIAFGVLAMHSSTLLLGLDPPEAIVNSQQSSRDVAFEFTSKFARFAIMQRYLNTLEDENDQAIQLNHQAHWRANVVSTDTRCAATGSAGRADGILECRREDGKAVNNAILMSKSNWGYNDDELAKIFEIRSVIANGRFTWHAENTATRLVRQFWGSMVAMKCNFGIWTNGEKVFLAIKKGENELVVTQTKPWSHNETAKAIIGLTYAAIDEKSGKWTNRIPAAQPNANIIPAPLPPVDIISELIG